MTYSFVYFTLLFGRYLLVYLFITSILKSLVVLGRFYKMIPCTFAVSGASCTLNSIFFFFFFFLLLWNSEISSFFRALQLNFLKIEIPV